MRKHRLNLGRRPAPRGSWAHRARTRHSLRRYHEAQRMIAAQVADGRSPDAPFDHAEMLRRLDLDARAAALAQQRDALAVEARGYLRRCNASPRYYELVAACDRLYDTLLGLRRLAGVDEWQARVDALELHIEFYRALIDAGARRLDEAA